MPVLSSDADRLFLFKPAGIPVFPPHADPDGDCLLARLLAAVPAQAGDWPAGFQGGIAHRLDTATSGLVLAARSPDALAALRAQFAARVLRKHYVFQAEGVVTAERWPRVVDVEIAHHPNRRDRMVARRGPRTAHRGRWYPAWSAFSPCAHPTGKGLWNCEIRTGVTHQVRVHAAWLGLPLTGDALYGGPPGRYVLHARRVDGPGWSSPDVPLPEEAFDGVV